MTLDSGVTDLDSGAHDLLDGMTTLADGTGTLDSGTQDLLDGINKLNDEGIKKITELFGDNASDVIDRLKAVEDAGKDYNIFSEALDYTTDDGSQANSVKFIFKTDAIKADD